MQLLCWVQRQANGSRDLSLPTGTPPSLKQCPALTPSTLLSQTHCSCPEGSSLFSGPMKGGDYISLCGGSIFTSPDATAIICSVTLGKSIPSLGHSFHISKTVALIQACLALNQDFLASELWEGNHWGERVRNSCAVCSNPSLSATCYQGLWRAKDGPGCSRLGATGSQSSS